ncbi:MAG: amidase [Hyphomicrobiaceae bacterium]|nr:amidase [Hyphomicrobiaceae bacterium]
MHDRREFLVASGQLISAVMVGRASDAEAAKDPVYSPATELLARFRERKLFPMEVLEAQIERIEALNDKVNCITYKHYDEARTAARESERRYRLGNPRPLEGITVAVKDEYQTKGWVTTKGSLLLKDAPPATEDNAVIDMLRQAGAVFHVQTTAPEFGSWMTTVSLLWGVTRNPWNLAYSPGGSSGGSGAALAAGFTTLALGSDLGGSIRIPASLCGLYGFKPPFGRVPTSEIPYLSNGPMARTFDDLNLVTRAMVGPHPLVHSSLRPRLEFPGEYAPVEGWKVAYDPAPGLSQLDTSVRSAMEGALERVKALGVMVEPVDLGFKSADLNAYLAGVFSTSIGELLTTAAKYPDEISPYLRFLLDRVQGKTGPGGVAVTEVLLGDYHRRAQQQLFARGFQALVMPTVATPFVPAEHGLKPAEDTVTIDAKPVTGLTFALTWVWNLLGRYPVVSAPVGIGPNGVPIGMQIVANTFDDLTAYRLAAAFARAAPPLFTGSMFPDFREDASAVGSRAIK